MNINRPKTTNPNSYQDFVSVVCSAISGFQTQDNRVFCDSTSDVNASARHPMRYRYCIGFRALRLMSPSCAAILKEATLQTGICARQPRTFKLTASCFMTTETEASGFDQRPGASATSFGVEEPDMERNGSNSDYSDDIL
jgi:hypothetical protein